LQCFGRRRIGLSIVLCLAASISTAEPDDADQDPPWPPADASVEVLRAALDTGEVTPMQLLQRSLARIEALDRHGLELNSLVAVDPRARGADGADSAIAGIPIVVGDMIDVVGLPTTVGSATLRGHRPKADAAAVAALRAEGALLFAKGNTRELGLSASRPGYSSAGGQSVNPYRRSRVSPGTAVAVAAGLAPIGIASDGGDLRVGAAHTGLVAIRPTRGLASRGGMLPAPLSLDMIGPTARSVADAALVLGILTDAASDGSAEQVDPKSYADAAKVVSEGDLDGHALDGMRIGIFASLRGGNAGVDGAFRDAVADLERAGAETIELPLPAGFESGWSEWGPLLHQIELRDQLNAYLSSTTEGRPHNLEAMLRVSRSPLILGSASPVDPAAVAMLQRALDGPGLASGEYLDLLSMRLPAIRATLLEQFEVNQLAAITFPTTLCPASSRLDDYDTSYDCDAPEPNLPTALAAASGLPEVTLPVGYTKHGLPVGLSLLGAPFTEVSLIRIAAVLEQVNGEPPWPSDVPRSLPPTDD
jgi:amidase